MNVFRKYLLKSISEKKRRTFLLLFSIGISSALLIASLGSVKAFLGTINKQIDNNIGDYKIELTPKNNSEIPLINPIENSSSMGIKDMRKYITLGGYLSNNSEKQINLWGTTLTDFYKSSSMKILKKDDLEPFTGKKLIISERTCDKLKLKLGDTIPLTVNGKEDGYKIVCITSNNGAFFTDKENDFTLITPEENLFTIYGKKNEYNKILVSIKSKDLNSWVKDFNNKNKDTNVVATKIYDGKDLEQQLGSLKKPLYFMLAIVLLMTTFIIYSSFKLIITERLPVIGVFLSQGATKGNIIKMLLKESLVYGILGGIVGDLIGAGFTSLFAYLTNPFKQYGIKATIKFYPSYFIAGFIFAILLSVVSTLLPVLSIRKLPEKEIILDTLSTSNRISLKATITGIVFIVISTILHILGSSIKYVGALPSFFLAFIGIILIIPKVVDIISYPFILLFRKINGLTMLSFNNVRTSKVLVNNIRLIAVSVISIVMISSLSLSLNDEIKGVYNDMNYDVGITVNSIYNKDIYKIVNNYNDSKVINESGLITANLNGNTAKQISISYVDPQKYKTFEKYTVFDNKNKELDALKSNEDGIILSKQNATRYKIKKGDTISLSTTDNKIEKFKVLSIFNPKMAGLGNYNLISSDAASKHFDIKYPTQYYISTKVSQKEAKIALKNQLKGLGTDVTTKDDTVKDNEDNNKQLTNILKVFSYLTMVIGAFGIVSNVSISFIQRKREISVLSSIGLTKAGRRQMILIEALFQAIIGSIISLIAAFGITMCFMDIAKFLLLGLDFEFPYNSIVITICSVVVLMILTSFSSIFKSNRLEIVNELKYE